MITISILFKNYLLYIISLCLVILFIFSIFFYAIVSSPYIGITSVKENLQITNNKIATLTVELRSLEKQIQKKENSLTNLYVDFFGACGKLTIQTIVTPESTRLRFCDAELNSKIYRAKPKTSRTYQRYSPETFDITFLSAITASELNYVLKNAPMQGLGESFINAELDTGINAVFLAAIAIHESNWGKSTLATERNNLFGFAAYTSTPENAIAFASKEDAIAYVAQFLRTHYIDGDYYRGHTIRDINELYAADKNWSIQIFSTMQKIDEILQNNDFSTI